MLIKAWLLMADILSRPLPVHYLSADGSGGEWLQQWDEARCKLYIIAVVL